MRRIITTAVAIAATVGMAVPASATAPAATRASSAPVSAPFEWEPAPSAPWEAPAGSRCDFAISGVPIVDEVKKLTLETYPDGSPKAEFYTGDLIIRVTNLETGDYHDADASGDAVIEYMEDGSMRWYVRGPVLIGMGENSNRPRGTYIFDGIFTVDFSATGYREVNMIHGTEYNVCDEIA